MSAQTNGPGTLPADNARIFENLLDAFPDMIHSVAENGMIVYANRTAEALLGYTRDELLSMHVHSIYADEVQEALKAGFADLKTRDAVRVESILSAKDGTRIPVEIRSFSIRNEKGAFVRTFSIVRDMRPIRELQNSLVHAGRLAAIGEHSAGIAHDINNPLTVVLLSNEMIHMETSREKTPDIERIRESTEDITKAAGAIRKLSDHLRNFSRGVSDAYTLVDLDHVMEDALFITDSRLRQIGARLHWKRTHGVTMAKGSDSQLQQVFINLIGNACDAMTDRATRDLHIEIEALTEMDERFWLCRVSDTGPGVAADIRETLFKPFATTKPKGEGTGLGLSISRNIVKQHGGELFLETPRHGGATITAKIPAWSDGDTPA